MVIIKDLVYENFNSLKQFKDSDIKMDVKSEKEDSVIENKMKRLLPSKLMRKS